LYAPIIFHFLGIIAFANWYQWAIFDLADHPVSSFYKGRVCLLGDAAHATSPHAGAGGGFCIEDSAVLATLLEAAVKQTKGEDAAIPLETVFAAFDASRRERSQWLVKSSRFIGECYQWQAEGVGRDFARIEEEVNKRVGIISTYDVVGMCEQAKEDLARRLQQV
jgi:salicylate hydroxylase